MTFKAGTAASSHMSYDQASAQVDAYVKQSLAALPAGSSLTSRGSPVPLPCSDSDGAPASTPVSVQSDYWVDGIATSGNEKYLDDFVTYWRSKGWQVSLDRRPNIQYVVLASSDGFEVVMQLTPDGSRLSVSGASPCVAPKVSASPSASG